MSLTRHITAAFADESVTLEKLAANTLPTSVKISTLVVANSTWSSNGSSTISASTGGYVLINGNNFVSGVNVFVGTTGASSVSFMTSQLLRVTLAGSTAGSYIVHVINPDGSVATRVNGITYA